MSDAQGFIDRLVAIVGPRNVMGPQDDLAPYVTDWRERYHGQADAVVKPANVSEVSQVVALAHREGVAIVPQGGNTGLCGGATPTAPGHNLVIRLDRMRAIRTVSPLANTITVEAGCVLADIQAAAEAADRYFPLSLGAEGSCQIGGNIGTNAGGTAVLRYGPTRELVLGVEAVLPDGRIFDGLRALRKDNTGYDLKQLFIGAEGTLGIITGAVLKLFARPRVSLTALAMLPGVEQALEVMGLLRSHVGDRLGSLEIMNRSQIEAIRDHVPDTAIPFSLDTPWYLIIELTDTLAGTDLATPLEAALGEALERELISDALIASSEAQGKGIWKGRHSVSEGNKRSGLVVSHDSAVPLDRQAAFAVNVERRIQEAVPHAIVAMHGHIGDGNIHVCALIDRARLTESGETERVVALINGIVDDETRLQRGAISAEHGIGLSNRGRLARVTDPLELDLMRAIKGVLDPAGLMNPGKVLMD